MLELMRRSRRVGREGVRDRDGRRIARAELGSAWPALSCLAGLHATPRLAVGLASSAERGGEEAKGGEARNAQLQRRVEEQERIIQPSAGDGRQRQGSGSNAKRSGREVARHGRARSLHRSWENCWNSMVENWDNSVPRPGRGAIKRERESGKENETSARFDNLHC